MRDHLINYINKFEIDEDIDTIIDTILKDFDNPSQLLAFTNIHDSLLRNYTDCGYMRKLISEAKEKYEFSEDVDEALQYIIDNDDLFDLQTISSTDISIRKQFG